MSSSLAIIAYKAVDDSELHIKHYKVRNIYTKNSYHLLLYLQNRLGRAHDRTVLQGVTRVIWGL